MKPDLSRHKRVSAGNSRLLCSSILAMQQNYPGGETDWGEGLPLRTVRRRVTTGLRVRLQKGIVWPRVLNVWLLTFSSLLVVGLHRDIALFRPVIALSDRAGGSDSFSFGSASPGSAVSAASNFLVAWRSASAACAASSTATPPHCRRSCTPRHHSLASHASHVPHTIHAATPR
jgi:hypothetical protein